MPFLEKQYSDKWAYDLSKNYKTEGELWDDSVIKQSIELIIGTIFGERLFNFRFGTKVFSTLFEGITESTGEEILTTVIEAIKEYEDRVVVDESNCELLVYNDDNSIVIKIPYQITRSGKESIWEKKILN